MVALNPSQVGPLPEPGLAGQRTHSGASSYRGRVKSLGAAKAGHVGGGIHFFVFLSPEALACGKRRSDLFREIGP